MRQTGRQRLSETEGQRREGLYTSKRQRAKALTMLPRLNETNSSSGDKEGDNSDEESPGVVGKHN